MPDDPTARSLAPLTRSHLTRLATMADMQHAQVVREGSRQHAWAERRVAVVLAQGGAQHFLDGTNGVKDLDVWTFYAALPGTPLRCGRYETHADFGRSVHGRQLYPRGFAHPQASTWRAYQGRRVDFLVRDLPVRAEAGVDEVNTALRTWLSTGSQARGGQSGHHPTSWHLSRKAMIWLAPATPGDVIWPVA
jgi:hypothetical protein